MDALVATFRILYDPVKRLEYNAKVKRQDRHSKDEPLSIKQSESKLDRSVIAELNDINSRYIRVSRFKRHPTIKKRGRLKETSLDSPKTPNKGNENRDSNKGKDVPSIPHKRNDSQILIRQRQVHQNQA